MRERSQQKLKMLNRSREKLQMLPFTRLLPNIATVMALCIGLSSIRFALLNRFEEAVIALLAAAVLDAMDGRLARLLGAASDFGAELDSLSDFVSFGVAPAVVIYILSLSQWKGFGWAVALFFAVCMGLRLARFNIANKSNPLQSPPAWSGKFFTGVPAPAGALLGIAPLVFYLATGVKAFINPFCFFVSMACTGCLMISRLPTFSFKTVHVPPRLVLPVLVVVCIGVAILLSEPWLTISGIALLYLSSIPYSFYAYKKLSQHEQEPPSKTTKQKE